MRIIDKNTDYYDYLQYINPDDTFTFDRTDSYELTKEILCEYLWLYGRRQYGVKPRDKTIPYKFFLMQIGSTFWLFLLGITKLNDTRTRAADYDIELLKCWKNYDKPRELIKLSIISFNWKYNIPQNYGWYFDDYVRADIDKSIDILVKGIDINDFDTDKVIEGHTVWIGDGGMNTKREEKHIPLLKSCGIAAIVLPEDIYNAFDEYFSLEKTASESTVAEGTTNNDKIINHGFDTKTSFRGKTK